MYDSIKILAFSLHFRIRWNKINSYISTIFIKSLILPILLFPCKPIFAQENKMSLSLNITRSRIILFKEAALYYVLPKESDVWRHEAMRCYSNEKLGIDL